MIHAAQAILIALLLAPLASLFAADGPAKAKAAVPPEFVGITDDPKLPRVLLMGDSVSIAYALEVRKLLTGVANVHRVPSNCGSTKVAVGYYGLVRWLPDPQEKWDVIHFNHGLHDLSYRFADDRDKNDQGEYASPANGGHQNVPPAEYEKNLRQIIARLKQTGAKLIFASTTPVPESDAAKYVKDSELPYNDIAKTVMAEHGVAWNDLWSLVKPRQGELQIPRNVHFQAKGSSVMAKQVAAVIRDALSKPSSTTREDRDTADFRLGSPFSDHMVLQRDKPVSIWGWADAGESVTVSFAGQSKSATAGTDGKWSLKLDALTASAEPRGLLVTGKEGHKVEVKDVLVGEVWLGSGQSNMEMAVGGANNAAAEQAAANFPLIRYYAESSAPAEKPQPEGKGLWQPCTPTNVRRFSATLYFFGREIHREVGVPVGLICSAVGATHIEAWIPAEAQSADAETKAEYDSQLRGWQHFDEAKLRADYPKKLAAWKLAVEQGKAGAKDKPWTPEATLAHLRRKGPPAGLYNGKIVNLAPFTLRGMLWYQGESNAGHPGLYHKQLTQLVTSWRTLWNDELPFAWVQLPNFTAPGEGWPRMREAMLKTLTLPKTGMAITIDLGDAKDIHPKNKQDVGKRLSFWALGTVYGKDVPATSGPLPAGSTISGNAITVSFKHASGGLKSITGGPLPGFQIAAADQQWKPAEAKIVGETVVVSSAEVVQPVAVRYAWKDWPDYSLANGAGLPASPFRTDDWPVPVVKK